MLFMFRLVVPGIAGRRLGLWRVRNFEPSLPPSVNTARIRLFSGNPCSLNVPELMRVYASGDPHPLPSAKRLCRSCASFHLTQHVPRHQPQISHHRHQPLYPPSASLGTNPDKVMASAPAMSLPQTHMRTCNLCRQRRVKCDRGAPQCSACLKSGADCVYPPGRGRAPKKPRHGAAPQVTERLARLESIIKELSTGGPATPPSAHETTGGQQAVDETGAQALDQEFSRLKVDDSKSYYVNNALWVTLADEVLAFPECHGSDGHLTDLTDARSRSSRICCSSQQATRPSNLPCLRPPG